ncbi:hypothetical protein B0H15DRAFT_215220 [Mycena belliarum]|uniref:Uncharacterized protein n=1 Tax=Mycena belliarum TaxID=1033014 RepID=A0AAD6UPH9_9AGAR|nr:hypothetical protein B0H15DRAFT_215220 [Mycena belliae]
MLAGVLGDYHLSFAAAMFLPTSAAHNDREVCNVTRLDCADSVLPEGQGSPSPGSDVEHDIAPVYSTPGAHRFIGVASTGTLLILVCLSWLAFRTWRRRKMQIPLHRESMGEGNKKTLTVAAEPPN